MSLVRTSYTDRVMHKVGVRVPLERRHVRQLCCALSKWTMVIPRPLYGHSTPAFKRRKAFRGPVYDHLGV